MSANSTIEAPAGVTKFHLSLNVNDLERSVRFLQALLGAPPAKRRHDYAKFEIDDPPLVLSLEPHGFSGRGALNHVGFRMPDSAALVAAQRRLETAGISTQREEGVECCYARQTKFWATDPDGTLWEVYVFEGDIDHRGAGQALEVISPSARSAERETVRVSVAHRLGQPFGRLRTPDGLECGDGSVDEVLLQGTFNARTDDAERQWILREVRRVLRPGGQLLVHVLTSSAPLPTDARLQLPGPAAAVEQAPVDRQLVADLEEAGFVGVHYAKFGASPCFHYAGVEMRETKLLAFEPAGTAPAACVAVYKGPFREIRDDAGRVFRRGERVPVDEATRELLQAGPAAAQFLFLGVHETVEGDEKSV
ncbi:MAG TPA: ArsI/CadI family heavy metal resistance metalloenzyme [Pirellulales bacterium]|nr:ArsI/CadI family heavy metal resistance metalloenzyme [Pirellulales bacterium]